MTDLDLESDTPCYKLERGDRVIAVGGRALENDSYLCDAAREVSTKQLLSGNSEEAYAEDIDTTNQSSDNVGT